MDSTEIHGVHWYMEFWESRGTRNGFITVTDRSYLKKNDGFMPS